VLFTEAADFEPGEAIRTVKETLRAVPNQGFGFGVARHLSSDAEAVAAMRGVPTPTVGFNYLGQFDQVLGGDARFRWPSEPFGPATDPSGPRVFVLEAYGQVSGGRLELDFEYSESLHERATIEALAKDFLATLRSLIEHCLDPTAGGFTVSDFADFAWDEEDLGSIASAIEKSQGGAASSGSESG